jgi:glutamate formiminotransferase
MVSSVIEAVINVSEGRDASLIAEIGRAADAEGALLDIHSDPYHHRSVFTLAGQPPQVEVGALALAVRALELLDVRDHSGVHPRVGVVDVVPFVPYGSEDAVAVAARTRFALAFSALGVPCYLYGFGTRDLPEIRRRAGGDLEADVGPSSPHPTAGCCCVGARDPLVAYNLVVAATLSEARELARSLRRREVRALGLETGDEVQLSFNLVEPDVVGPAQIADEVARHVPIVRAELVGLVPAAVLRAIPSSRWADLDLGENSTIEARLSSR